MIYEKLSPALAALMFEYVRFPEATAASVNGTRPQSLTVSAAGLPETTVFVYCDKDAEFEDLPGVRVISGKGEIRTAKVELEKISDLSEHGGV
ncbi:MAG: hypothetical protein LH472_04660, partial [Pyrinomonadaceae bacterium]|nr:hypothetical protein [Pyrinomonadaceae bacterium]